MYNLLISAFEDAWENGEYSYSYSRYLEYTQDNLYDKFKILDSETKEILMKLPTIFAYETGVDKPPVFGKITKISLINNTINLSYEVDNSIKLPNEFLENNKNDLGISKYELTRTHWAIKDVDISNISAFKKKSSIQTVNDLLKFSREISTSLEDLFNVSATFKSHTVDNFIDYYAKIKKLTSENYNQEYEFFYRGHGDKNYKLVPTLLRNNELGFPEFIKSEEYMFKDIIIENPNDFKNDNTTIEKLVRMQHYSLPTRLLDITSNPLIALYFACNSGHELIGEVVVFKIKKELIKYYDSDTVSCISNLSQLNNIDREKLGETIDDPASEFNTYQFNNVSEVQKLLHFIRREKPYFAPNIIKEDLSKILCIKSKKSNDRVISQSGNFLLFGLNAVINENSSKDIIIQRIK